ncbi:MAG: DUF5682 family protein [Sedimentitalea sp.]
MTDRSDFEALRRDLFQAERGLYVVPVRHHSPSCAAALRALIAEVQPKQILIEAPSDFTDKIPLLLDPATRPPVALVAMIDRNEDQGRVAGYYPFCAHSPEYVALVEGQKIDATLRFIDAPAADKAMRGQLDGTEPSSLVPEHHFNSSDYIAALVRQIGCRDGFELWDHLFESRIGQTDWRSFFGDVGVYCAGIRAATPLAQIDMAGDTNREAHMARAIKAALTKGGPVVVVVGGFHAPALVGALDADKPAQSSLTADCYLIRYGFRALDALNGYGAGLPQPGYYQRLWEQAGAGMTTQDWRALGVDLMADFTASMRGEGHIVPFPAQVEAIRAAESLAMLRSQPGAMRHDLIDGVQTALIKGETTQQDVWLTRFTTFLCGDNVGDVPPGAGAPPLVEDVRARAVRHRLDLSDSVKRRRKLDIRRNPAHLDASRFLHGLVLLGSSLAARQNGPDYLTNTRTELLFEEWSYVWSPQVEGHLIEQSVLGDDLPTACLGVLRRERARMMEQGRAQDVARLVDLLVRGLLAGLGAGLAPFVKNLASDVQEHATFVTATHALQRLMFVLRSQGPLGAPEALDLRSVVTSAYTRLVFLCDDLPRTSEDEIDTCLDALRTVTEILRDCEGLGLDPALLNDALDRITQRDTPPVILGAVLAVCVQAGTRSPADLIGVMQGTFNGVSLDTEDQIGALRGVLHTCPALLWHGDGLLAAIDAFLCRIPESRFLDLLPHLRLAFTTLNPRETDRLAADLAIVHNVQAGSLLHQSNTLAEGDLTRAIAIEKALVQGFARDGLTGWISKGDAR